MILYLMAAAVWHPVKLFASVPATRTTYPQIRAHCMLAPTTHPKPWLWCSLQGTEEPDHLRQGVPLHGQCGKSNSQWKLRLRSRNRWQRTSKEQCLRLNLSS